MAQYVMRGGTPLHGSVDISGAKNAALAIIAAAIMADEPVTISNLPDVNDVHVMLEAIREIGAGVERIDKHTMIINGSTINALTVDYEYIKKIRASYYLLGSLLGKYRNTFLLNIFTVSVLTQGYLPLFLPSDIYLSPYSSLR